jgi:hypothetical protein
VNVTLARATRCAMFVDNSLPYICHFCCTHCSGNPGMDCSWHHTDCLDNSASACQYTDTCTDLCLVSETTTHQYVVPLLQRTHGTGTANITHLSVRLTHEMGPYCHNTDTSLSAAHSRDGSFLSQYFCKNMKSRSCNINFMTKLHPHLSR